MDMTNSITTTPPKRCALRVPQKRGGHSVVDRLAARATVTRAFGLVCASTASRRTFRNARIRLHIIAVDQSNSTRRPTAAGA